MPLLTSNHPHLGHQICLFIVYQNTVEIALRLHACYMHAHLIPFDLIILAIFDGPPLWSSGQSSWLQIQRSGFDSRRYQIF
jgi:hypothetical protein